MLLSMTGFGDARGSGPGFTVAVELRAVNNRHLKLTVRGTDPYPAFDADIEKIVRKVVRRGSVQAHIRVERESTTGGPGLNVAAVRSYLAQLKAACEAEGVPEALPGLAAGILDLPGVSADSAPAGGLPEDEWPVVEKTIAAALVKFDAARKDEGRQMAAELMAQHGVMTAGLTDIRAHLPTVVAQYRERILERVRAAVAEAGVGVEPAHLIREVAAFADRTEVAEEVTRFAAHLDQFAEIVRVGAADGAGRRLEFVVQEMGREANTLGSKAGDVAVSRLVIELKAALEKVRELIQNVE